MAIKRVSATPEVLTTDNDLLIPVVDTSEQPDNSGKHIRSSTLLSAVGSDVSDLNTDVTALSAAIDTNTNSITANDSDISDINTDTAYLSAAIDTNTNSITANDEDISDNINNISSLTLDVSAVSGNLDTHIADNNNPHSVTKTQVGLGSVVDGALPSTRNDHGTVSGAIDLSANYTEHTADFTENLTLSLIDFAEGQPSSAFTFSVSGGGTPTVTLSASPAPVFWTTQTLSTLVDGDYRSVFLYDGTNYDVYVDVK